jgi:hypothetical protein
MGPMHDLPPSLEESILEAEKALDIGNCKSSIVMSHRAGGNIPREISVYSLNAEIFENPVSLGSPAETESWRVQNKLERPGPKIGLRSVSERCCCE